jgi:hypothetical protein
MVSHFFDVRQRVFAISLVDFFQDGLACKLYESPRAILAKLILIWDELPILQRQFNKIGTT